MDFSFLTYQRRTRARTAIGLFIEFQGTPPTVDDLRERLRARLSDVPSLRAVPRSPRRPWQPPRWEVLPGVDWTRRVLESFDDNGAANSTSIEEMLREPLPTTEPLWRCRLIRGPGDSRWALLFQVHHAVADGISVMDLADRAFGSGSGRAGPPGPRSWAPRGIPTAGAAWRTVLRRGPATIGRLLRHRSPAAPGPPEPVRFSREDVAVDRLRAIARGCGVTVNDVVLAVAGGALERLSHPGRAPGGPRRALIPVSSHDPRVRLTPGNNATTMDIDLPTGDLDPARRLQAVAATMNKAKQDGRSALAWAANRVFPRPVFHATFHHGLSSTFSDLLISNWGSLEQLSFDDSRAHIVVPVMFRPRRHHLAIAFATHHDTTHIGFVTTGAYSDIADHWRTELAKLCAHTGIGDR